MTERDDNQRLASGWGRREPRPSDHDWSGDDRSPDNPSEPAEDLEIGGDEGAITGRATTRDPQGLVPGDTLGGARDPDPADDGRSTDGGGLTEDAGPTEDARPTADN